MVLVLKLISTAFDVGDGAKRGALTPHQAACALPQRPSLLACAGYVLYPGSLLAGPWLPYAEYAAFINRTGVRPARNGRHFAHELTSCAASAQVWAPTAPKRPSALLPAARRVALGVVFAALHARLAPLFPEAAFLSAAWVRSRSVPAKVAYMHAMGFASRCKYYFVWLLADAACCAGGLGWSGYDEAEPAANGDKKGGASKKAAAKKVAKWERTCNVHPLGVELATSAAELPLTWNTATGAWLRHYSYERLLSRPASLPHFAALLLTQTVSGLWHGVHAGYALFFVGSGLMLQASKVIFRYQRAIPPKYAALRRATSVLHWALAAFHLSYLAAAFISVTLPAGRAAFESVGYAGHVSMAVRKRIEGRMRCARADVARGHRASACWGRCCRRRAQSEPRRRPERASATERPRSGVV